MFVLALKYCLILQYNKWIIPLTTNKLDKQLPSGQVPALHMDGNGSFYFWNENICILSYDPAYMQGTDFDAPEI